MQKKIGLIFSKSPETPDPLIGMGEKRPVYEDLFHLCKKEGMEMVIVTTKKYQGNGLFDGFWPQDYEKQGFLNKKIALDLAYDRSGGLDFPKVNDTLRVVDNRDFKQLAWNKWEAYLLLRKYMAKSFMAENMEDLGKVVSELDTELIVVKPIDGLKGRDIFVGEKEEALKKTFNFDKTKYLVSEFVETKNGIKGLVSGRHDLRVVLINGKIVWSHVRTPYEGGYAANVATGGILKEVEVGDLPTRVVEISLEIAKTFLERYDNPVYSIDFGIESSGTPVIFEINDQIGFPKPDMKAKDLFLSELVQNFKSKLN